jgi:methyl-accepting chemotaxis protein
MMKLSIGTKLFILFGIMIALFLGFSFYVRGDLKAVKVDITKTRDIQKEMMAAKNIQMKVLNAWQYMTDASLTRDTAVIENEAKPNIENAKKMIDEFLTIGNEGGHHQELLNVKKDLDDLWRVGNSMFEAYGQDIEKGNRVMSEFDGISEKVIKAIADVVYKENVEEDGGVDKSLKGVEKSLKVAVVILSLGMAIGGVILFYLIYMNKSITHPLTKLVKAANEIAAGDLSVEIEGLKTNNEIGELAQDFNKMVNSLRKILSDVGDGIVKLAASAENLSESAVQIVEGSQDQNMKTSQVATASQELNSTINDVTSNASSAAESARDANRVASSGGEIVEKSIISINSIADTSRETAKVMSVLGNRSNEVGAIIKVIDDIANQTNLLALNAAIEAARAGEQGRGFAVVADEVRKLAEKTSEATKEIGDTIKVIQEDTGRAISSMDKEIEAVEDGVSLAKDAGEALKEIVGKVDTVSSMIEQIATASEQESAAAEQIGGDIETVANISQQTFESAQKIAAGSQDIAILAYNLRSSVTSFKKSAGIKKTGQTGKTEEEAKGSRELSV